MEFIKKYKLQTAGLILFIIIIVFAFITIVNLVYPDASKSFYGNRLEGIEKYPISEKKMKTLLVAIKETGSINQVSYNIQGKIINFVIDVKKDTDLITAKAISDKILEAFSAGEKDFYDIQLFITSNDQSIILYPIIGYKHHTSLIFRWTNNS